MLDADYTPEARQQSADHPQSSSNVDRQPASVPLGASAASPINTATSADRQPVKPVASAASAQGSGLEAASAPVCAERHKNSAALPKPGGPDSDPALSSAAASRKTPTAMSRQQAPGQPTQGTGQQQGPDATPVGGMKPYAPGDFQLADARHYLATGASLSRAATQAVTEAKNASSMRGAQLSGGSQQQGSPRLHTVSSVASVVSSLEGDAGSEVFPQTGLGQERSAVGGDQVGIQTAQAALLFCRIGSRFNVSTCLVLRDHTSVFLTC